MAVHAHPDDESSSTGGVLARYSAEGIRTVVVTCTNGEYGDGPGHVKPGADGHDPEQVAKTRLAELELACEHLGVWRSELLGYHDSGMPDWAFREDDHVFWNADPAEPVARLVELFERHRPDVVVTYDDNAGYNHPDHLRANHVTIAAIEATDIPSKAYLIARRRHDWDGLRERAQAAGVELPTFPSQTPERIQQAAEREAQITTSIDVSAVVGSKRAALASHASQLDQAWWVDFPDELFAELFGRESFIRYRDRTGAPVPEDDLFAGLR